MGVPPDFKPMNEAERRRSGEDAALLPVFLNADDTVFDSPPKTDLKPQAPEGVPAAHTQAIVALMSCRASQHEQPTSLQQDTRRARAENSAPSLPRRGGARRAHVNRGRGWHYVT
jgi:hypothetical protein